MQEHVAMDGTGAGCSTLWLGKGSYKHTCPVQRGGEYQRQTSNADFNADGMLQGKSQRQNSNADGRPFQRRRDASKFQRRWEPPVLLLNGCPLPSKSSILLHSNADGKFQRQKDPTPRSGIEGPLGNPFFIFAISAGGPQIHSAVAPRYLHSWV